MGRDHRNGVSDIANAHIYKGLVDVRQQPQALHIGAHPRDLDDATLFQMLIHLLHCFDCVEIVLSQHIGTRRQRGPGVDPSHLDDVELRRVAHQSRTAFITDQFDVRVFTQSLRELLRNGIVDF